MSAVGRILMLVGALGLLHGGYSVNRYMKYLKISNEEYTSLPVDVSMTVVE